MSADRSFKSRGDPADVLARGLAEQGANVAFGVPGGGPNLDVVGAFLKHGIQFVLAHAETASCIMASTWGWITGNVTAAVVTRGPGAASAVNGAAQATLDRQPLILVTDSVPTKHRDRVPHQRIDQQTMLAPACKTTVVWGADADEAQISSVIAAAKQAPAGAVHLDYDASGPSSPVEPIQVVAASTGLAKELLDQASQPVIIVGVGASAAPGVDTIRSALIDYGAPVFTTYQGIGVVPTEDDLNAGLFTNGSSERSLLERADLIVAIGLDMVEPIPAEWNYEAAVVTVAEHPTEDPYLPIAVELVGDLTALTVALLGEANHDWSPVAGQRHRAKVRGDLLASESSDSFGPISLVSLLASTVSPDLTVTVDAGAHFLAIMPLWPVESEKRVLISNGLATMGYAVPAAIGAAFARPGDPVLALTGDGGLGMCLAELETIARLDLPITVVVFNDAALSLIEIKQQPQHGGEQAVRYSPTDFAAAAVAMGMEADVVTTRSDLQRVLDGHTFTKPYLVDARIDPSAYPGLLRVTRG